jgi:restriction system protein
MVRIRFRVGAYLAAGVAIGLAAHAAGADVQWSAVAGALGPALLVMLPRFVFGAVAGAFRPVPRAHPAAAMSGTEFEEYVADVARRCGVPVIMTPRSGDWGVDLVVGRRPNRIAIQCKRRSRPVGPGAVQEVVAGAPMQGCTQTMVVSNQEFTPAAAKLAELHGCVLVGGAQLPALRATLRRLTADPLPERAGNGRDGDVDLGV